jgi:hypothetical protein
MNVEKYADTSLQMGILHSFEAFFPENGDV